MLDIKIEKYYLLLLKNKEKKMANKHCCKYCKITYKDINEQNVNYYKRVSIREKQYCSRLIYNLGLYYQNTNQNEESFKHFQRFHTLCPQNKYAKFNLGFAYYNGIGTEPNEDKAYDIWIGSN